ncbi:MAG: cupin domain-containing protein [Xanthobacteraceae bacterium]|nr:cupin domain-containing protein [Xanthobacteraceae bacterium]
MTTVNGLAVLALAAVVLATVSIPAIKPPQTGAGHHAMVAAGGRPASTTRRLSCEPLADIPGKAVSTVVVTYPPNGYTPAHRHPGTVTAFVLMGTIRSQLSGGEPVLYKPGETWFEPPGTVHVFAENPSATESAELLAVFVADENCGPLVIPEPDYH